MKKKIGMLLCAFFVLSTLIGCGAEQNKDEVKTDATQTMQEENTLAGDVVDMVEPEEVKIWHDGDEAIMQTIADCVNEQLSADGISVVFEKKSGLTDQMKLYGSDANNGPDMYMYAHDSLGTFAAMGILSPINDLVSTDVMDTLLPMTVEAGNYQDAQYLLPVYYETLLFIYNTDLWEGEVPSTTDALYDYMVAHTDVDAGVYAVVNQHSTAYNVAPFINGFGGYIIDKDANPGLNLAETKDAIAYNSQFAALQADGDYNTVTTLFNEGKAAAIIGGPWLISGIKDAGINYDIKSLAEFELPNGNGMAPYSGVQGIGVLKHAAENKTEVIKKVLTAIASPEVGVVLANNSNCAPANSKSYEDSDVAENAMIMAMKKTAETAQPMPNIPEMGVMWGPTEQLLAAVNKSGEDVNVAADTYQEQALTAIADMQ